jgi:hypothetical protein
MVTQLSKTDRSTWVNISCPVDLSLIQSELIKIGGLIPDGNGEFLGKPNFIIVWGQEYKEFLLGKFRLKFSENQIPAEVEPIAFQVSQPVYERYLKWIQREELTRQKAYALANFNALAGFATAEQYLLNYEYQTEFERINSKWSETKVALSIRPNWRYLFSHYNYNEIGQQCFYVLQWCPAEFFGTEEDWAANRIISNYVPELDADIDFIDNIGHYPIHGKYAFEVMRIGTEIEPNFWVYKEPVLEEICNNLRYLLSLREQRSLEEQSPEGASRRRFKQNAESQEIRKQEFSNFFNDIFDNAVPVGNGQPTNISANKAKGAI